MGKTTFFLANMDGSVIRKVVATEITNGQFSTSVGDFNSNLIGLRKAKGYKLLPVTEELNKGFEEDEKKQRLVEARRNNKFLKNPTKTRVFNVGDKVLILNGTPGVIVESFDDGMFYDVECDEVSKIGGVERTTKVTRIIPWVRLIKIEHQADEVLHENKRMYFDFYKANMHTLLFEYYAWGIDMSPEYQRGYAWSDADKENLIDSIFKGIEIGRIVLVETNSRESEGRLYEVLDGKQRINAIVEFYEDKLRYKGHLFSELSFDDIKYFLSQFQVTMAVSREIMTLKKRYEQFILLNSQGVIMDSKHLDEVRERFNKM